MGFGSREKKRSFSNNFAAVLKRQTLCGPAKLCFHLAPLCMTTQARAFKSEFVFTTSGTQTFFLMLRTSNTHQIDPLVINVKSYTLITEQTQQLEELNME